MYVFKEANAKRTHSRPKQKQKAKSKLALIAFTYQQPFIDGLSFLLVLPFTKQKKKGRLNNDQSSNPRTRCDVYIQYVLGAQWSKSLKMC